MGRDAGIQPRGSSFPEGSTPAVPAVSGGAPVHGSDQGDRNGLGVAAGPLLAAVGPCGTRRDAFRSAQRAEDPVQTKRVFSISAISQEAAFPLLVVVRVEKVSLIAFSSLFTFFMRLIEIGQGYCFVGFLSFYIISFLRRLDYH